MSLLSKRREERRSSRFTQLGLGALAFLASAPAAWADPTPTTPDSGRLTLVEENDYFFFPTDHWYTQGLRLSYLTGEVRPDQKAARAFDLLDGNLFADSPTSRRVDWSFGQSIFTPTNVFTPNPDPHDRPYAGWAYFGAGLVQSTKSTGSDGSDGGSRLDDLEIQLGVVGPMALGEETQNDFHEFAMHEAVSLGWNQQLHNEPGLDIIYTRARRIPLMDVFGGAGDDDGIALDIVPDGGAALGNVQTYANGGATLRLGHGLDADYGPPRVQPAQSGGDWFDQSMDGLGFYAFAGVEARAVARDIFLAGNTFQPSARVSEVPLVGDFTYGGTLYWGQYLRATVSLDNRSREFYGQEGPDRFTSLSLSAVFDW